MQKDVLDAGWLPESNFCFERRLMTRGFNHIAGVDEVGRGPLAGPVVAACVVLPAGCDPGVFLDSKTLSQGRREELYRLLQEINASIGIGVVSVEKIDVINILQASLLAMRRAVEDLGHRCTLPDFILVDGKFKIPLDVAQQTLVKGETKSASIAAASIAAKVTRDAMMDELHLQYPDYNFAKHKGYPTREHRRAIAIHGPCTIHRKSFKGVKEFVR